MLKLGALPLVALCAFTFAEAEKPIDDLKTLVGDWRSVGNANPASIHINEDGTYQGTAASGAKELPRRYLYGVALTAGRQVEDGVWRCHRCAGSGECAGPSTSSF